MRAFHVTARPTDGQLRDAQAVLGDASVMGLKGYFIVVDDDSKPDWVGDVEEVNFPGQVHRTRTGGDPTDAIDTD